MRAEVHLEQDAGLGEVGGPAAEEELTVLRGQRLRRQGRTSRSRVLRGLVGPVHHLISSRRE